MANVRRTIYGKISRHDLNGLLRLFDFPDANITSDVRSETTVPQQQLFVLNSRVHDRASEIVRGAVAATIRHWRTTRHACGGPSCWRTARPAADDEVQAAMSII